MDVDLDATLGATYIGVVVASCLYGIATLQFYTYWNRYVHDSILDRLYVAVLWLVDTAKLVCATHVGYTYLVTNYADLQVVFYSTWSVNVEFCLTSVITFMVQVFFARRAWNFARRVGVIWATPWTMRLMGIAVGLLALMQLAFGIATVTFSWIFREFEDAKRYRWTAIVWLGSAAFCDILVTYTLAVVLITRRTGFQRTDALVNKVLTYTVNTGALTSVVAIFNLVLFASMDNLIQLGVNFSVGTLYVITLLATLNARSYETPESVVFEDCEYDPDIRRVTCGRPGRSSVASRLGQGHALQAVNPTGSTASSMPGSEANAVILSRGSPWNSQTHSQRSPRVYSIPGLSSGPLEVIKEPQHDRDETESIETRSERAKPGDLLDQDTK